jgi:menaquinone-dependent protoporphyrinogen oxidase
MKILVTAASKHGSTDEVARTIAEVLGEAGHSVAVAAPETVTSVDAYDAVVVGSAVYFGRWMEPATVFVKRLAQGLAGRPVWLFSIGPLGDPPKPEAEPTDVPALLETSRAREHRLFPGRLDKRGLSLGEKIVAKGVKAPEGDFRPWAEIRAWAAEIASSLLPAVATR